jgi:predicted HicB family RNase H-like nuclease
MEYKGYAARIDFDAEAAAFHGRVLNLRDVITFEGTSVAELEREFHASVNDYLDFCAQRNEPPEKPLSGRVLVRMSPDLHRSAALAAETARVSLNAWILRSLEAAVTR